ncbi:MAG TPA: type II secretion system protein [Thiobacillus sp.]|nr:type II secretion system protein [Thiobacillus sp.]HQT69671.1 type II secretion system protein [Thiobacillus sp.]
MPTGKSRQSGFTYLFILMLLALIGMGLAAAGTLWRTDAQSAREAELLFVGDQDREAIRRYYEFDPAQPRLPQTIDDLLLDNRRPTSLRHLRRAYRDPVTGGAFSLIRAEDGGGISGVHSPSSDTPQKSAGFAPAYDSFADAARYADWQFVFSPAANAEKSPDAAPTGQPAPDATGSRSPDRHRRSNCGCRYRGISRAILS